MNSFTRGLKTVAKTVKPFKNDGIRSPSNRSQRANPSLSQFNQLKSISKKARTDHNNLLAKVETFDQLKLDPLVRSCIKSDILGHLTTIQPTNIQKLVIKVLQSKRKRPSETKTTLIAAETGSGKTLAYLAPLVSKLKALETEANEDWTSKVMNKPVIRGIILVPTMELVHQVYSVVKQLSHTVKLSSATTYDGSKRVDILITTPSKVLGIKSKEALRHVEFVVIDEADTLMDETFKSETEAAIAAANASIKDLVFCSATIPKWFDMILTKSYPFISRVVSPSLHKIPRHVDFKVVEIFRAPFFDSKTLALQQACYAIAKDNTESGLVKRILVFVNSKETVKTVTDFLNDKGYPAEGITGAVERSQRLEILQKFVQPQALGTEAGADSSKKPVSILVATDLLARGINMENIRNVILFDLPRSSIDLLHRSGRTGRIGKRGRVLVFVSKGEANGWVKGLERQVKNFVPLG